MIIDDRIIYLILGGFVVLVIVLVYTYFRLKKEMEQIHRDKEQEIMELDQGITELKLEHQLELKERGKEGRRMGTSGLQGALMEFLGDFKVFVEYDLLGLIATPAENFPIDLIGVVLEDEDDPPKGKGKQRIDFIEFKSGRYQTDPIHTNITVRKDVNYQLSSQGKKIKKIVEEKKVAHRLVEIDMDKIMSGALADVVSDYTPEVYQERIAKRKEELKQERAEKKRKKELEMMEGDKQDGSE